MAEKTASERIETALRAAKKPLTIEQICAVALGRVGARERNLVLVNLHRLDARGLLVKYPQTYAIEG